MSAQLADLSTTHQPAVTPMKSHHRVECLGGAAIAAASRSLIHFHQTLVIPLISFVEQCKSHCILLLLHKQVCRDPVCRDPARHISLYVRTQAFGIGILWNADRIQTRLPASASNAKGLTPMNGKCEHCRSFSLQHLLNSLQH